MAAAAALGRVSSQVVLAVSIVTKSGKPLLSRQALGLPRPRLESLLASFPRLVSPASEHTVLEASGVRFVYTPLEDLYVLLITNTQSNILLDLSTLSLVTRIATELGSGGRGGAIGEYDVMRVSFEILSAWDEVVSLGWRENVNLQQVRSVLEMESHEEKIQEIIARNKEHEAKEELKRRAKQLEVQRREMTRRGQNPYANPSAGSYSQNSYTPAPSSFDAGATSSRPGYPSFDDRPAPSAKPFKTKGMQLGSKSKKQDSTLAEALGGLNVDDEPLLAHRQQEDVYEQAAPVPPPPAAAAKDSNPFGDVEPQDVHLVVREHLALQLNRDGGVESLTVKGDLDLRISDPAKSVLAIALPPPSSYSKANDLQFKTHPNVDKNAWAQRGEIRLKEGKKGFPVGQGLGVLKWRMTGTDESIVPISINCWPSADNGVCTVNLEYELENTSLSLHNVLMSLALPHGAQPTISEAPSQGSYSLSSDGSRLDWVLDEVSEQAGSTSGSMEFEVEGDDVDAFFPVVVDFVSQKGVCGVQVLSVSNPADNSAFEFSVDSLLDVERYEVV
ncbi:coatomer subunit delta [Microbotryomycetes sp. JL201]|nr:coatomer subunit delta [Microbotryomycetes sp. JL201]